MAIAATVHALVRAFPRVFEENSDDSVVGTLISAIAAGWRTNGTIHPELLRELELSIEQLVPEANHVSARLVTIIPQLASNQLFADRAANTIHNTRTCLSCQRETIADCINHVMILVGNIERIFVLQDTMDLVCMFCGGLLHGVTNHCEHPAEYLLVRPEDLRTLGDLPPTTTITCGKAMDIFVQYKFEVAVVENEHGYFSVISVDDSPKSTVCFAAYVRI